MTNANPDNLARAGLRRNAAAIAAGVAGVSALALLAAGSLAPLIIGGFTATAIGAWLGGLGGNALASWLDNWSRTATARAIGADSDAERRLMEQLARDLQSQIENDAEFAASVATLIQRTDAIPTALEALQGQGERQARLLQILLEDVQDARLCNERRHDVTLRAVLGQGESLRATYAQAHVQLAASIDAVLVEVGRLRATGAAARALQVDTPTAARSQISATRGLGRALLSSLSQALMWCDEFQSTPRLRAVFVIEELRIWREGLPEADNLRSRADLIIYYLREKSLSSGEHALVLLLDALANRYDQADGRHSLLIDLAAQLRARLDMAIETDISRKFQLEQQQKEEEAEVAKAEAHLDDIARSLQ